MKHTNETVRITPPKFAIAVYRIIGTAPYVQNKFTNKAKQAIISKQEKGSQAKKDRKREPKNFDQLFQQATHRSDQGWYGIPAPCFRNAMITACGLVGFTMSTAKLSIFVEPDGFDYEDSSPLVKILVGKPERFDAAVTLAGIGHTTDILPRPLWKPGWESEVRIKFDLDQFSLEDVTNLLARVGEQVGIGAGRPSSKRSAGMGWGLFKIKEVLGEKESV